MDVSSFDNNTFRHSLATFLFIAPSAITLRVSAGSVIVEATITLIGAGVAGTEDAVMRELDKLVESPSKASLELGVSISAISQPKKTMTQSLLPGVVSNESAAAAPSANGTSKDSNGGFVALAIVLPLTVLAVCIIYVVAQRRRQSMKRLLPPEVTPEVEVSSAWLSVEKEESSDDAEASKGADNGVPGVKSCKKATLKESKLGEEIKTARL